MTTHPLSKAAVEAATKALYRTACKQRDYFDDTEEMWEHPEFVESCTAGMNAALSAAFEQLKVENNSREGYGVSGKKGEWDCSSGLHVEGDFPVLIVRKAKP